MRAVYFEKFGSPEVLKFGDRPDPKPGNWQVAVAVKAASLNPVDVKAIEGHTPRLPLYKKFPRIPGSDFAGVVTAVGAGASRFKIGDKVYGITSSFFGGPGSHAEIAVANIRVVRKIPDGIDIPVAGSIPVAAWTALAGLKQCGELTGKRILLTGASGGVGHMTLQLAKYFGAHVTTVCSEKNIEFVKKLGADFTIDYKKTDYATLGEKYDIFFDAYGLTDFTQAKKVIRKNGAYVTTRPQGGDIFRSLMGFALHDPRVIMANLSVNKSGMETIERLLIEKKLTITVARQFALEKFHEAYASLNSGGNAGKIIFAP